jgi:hypothetical protein
MPGALSFEAAKSREFIPRESMADTRHRILIQIESKSDT